MARHHRRTLATITAVVLALAGCGSGDDELDASGPATSDPQQGPADDATDRDGEATGSEDGGGGDAAEMVRLDGITTGEAYVDNFGAESLAQWQEQVPGIEQVTIESSADGSEQPALWLPPDGDGDQPLLVTFHTWSSSYEQTVNIPFARWADEMGWAVMQHEFRGPNDNPEATGSDLTLSDTQDAIDWAIEQGGVDADRVYAIGFSGGGMMALLTAARLPDEVAAVAAWTPNYDLVDWYRHHEATGGWDYVEMLQAACGGDPTASDDARDDCLHRSPAGHLPDAGDVPPIYVAHGLDDPTCRRTTACAPTTTSRSTTRTVWPRTPSPGSRTTNSPTCSGARPTRRTTSPTPIRRCCSPGSPARTCSSCSTASTTSSTTRRWSGSSAARSEADPLAPDVAAGRRRG